MEKRVSLDVIGYGRTMHQIGMTERREKGRFLITIAAMMDPTEDGSYIRMKMKPWDSYLNEVQEQLLQKAVDETREVMVREVIQYLHVMEMRQQNLDDMKGRSRRLWDIFQESIAEVRQAIRERGMRPKPWGEIMTEKRWMEKVKRQTEAEWTS